MLSSPQYKKYARKVLANLCAFNKTMIAIKVVESVSIRARLYKLVMEESRKRAAIMSLPEIVRTHMVCVMVKGYREHICWR